MRVGGVNPVASEVEFLPDLIEFLATSPDQAAVCQFLALRWPGADPIHRAALLEVEQDASVRVTGWFGFNADILASFQRTSLWDDLPVSVAIRTQRTVLFTDADQLDTAFPQLNDAGLQLGSLVAAPIISAGHTIGACVLVGDEGISTPEEHVEELQSVCLLLGLYLLSLPDHIPNDSAELSTLMRAERAVLPNALSDRQHAVLGYLAQHLTNRQIATRMGFSESTIRQETMAIYRFLQVSGRREAVRVALARGLIDSADREAVEQQVLISSAR